MKKLLREPLLHFLVLGAALFVVFGFIPKQTGDKPGKIVVTQAQIAALAEGFARTWQRPPTDVELQGLIRDRVREEIYCREAVALGLDRDDSIIRRRLRQKMEFISDDVAAQAEPTDADLSAYLLAHPDSFRLEQRFTFTQVFLSPDRHGDNLARDARQLLAQLSRQGSKADLSTAGDPFLLEHQFIAAPLGDIARQFGPKFAQKLIGLPGGQWQGPIESGFGSHLVFISERTDGRMPALGEVRDAVRREWSNTLRMEANDKFFQQLLNRYTVTIESRPLSAGHEIATIKIK